MLGFSAEAEAEAAFLSEGCSEVLFFPTDGSEPKLPESIRVIREKPAAIEKWETGLAVKTEQGAWNVDGVFVLREAVAPGQLVPGLETEGPHVKVNRRMETSLPGLFACGDITGTPYQYVKAAGEGNVAALSASAYIEKKKKERME